MAIGRAISAAPTPPQPPSVCVEGPYCLALSSRVDEPSVLPTPEYPTIISRSMAVHCGSYLSSAVQSGASLVRAVLALCSRLARLVLSHSRTLALV